MIFCIVHSGAGEILTVIEAPSPLAAHQLGPVLRVYRGAHWLHWEKEPDPALEYVLDRTVVPRPIMGAVLSSRQVPADDATPVLLSNVPLGAMLHVEDQVIEAVETEIELTFDLPGRYVMRLSLFPYQDQTLEIEAL